MTTKIFAVTAFALPLMAASAAWAGGQTVSPTNWQEWQPARTTPYALTGSERAPERSCWSHDVQRFGSKVEITRFRRLPASSKDCLEETR